MFDVKQQKNKAYRMKFACVKNIKKNQLAVTKKKEDRHLYKHSRKKNTLSIIETFKSELQKTLHNLIFFSRMHMLI